MKIKIKSLIQALDFPLLRVRNSLKPLAIIRVESHVLEEAPNRFVFDPLFGIGGARFSFVHAHGRFHRLPLALQIGLEASKNKHCHGEGKEDRFQVLFHGTFEFREIRESQRPSTGAMIEQSEGK